MQKKSGITWQTVLLNCARVGRASYIGREGVPMDGSPGKECGPVIVFESLDLSVGQ